MSGHCNDCGNALCICDEIAADNERIKKETGTYHLEMLKRCADNIAIRFNCPVYLIGSFLEKALDGLDVDIIIVMNEDRMLRLFKSVEFNERRHRFNLKQKKYFEDYITDVDIDFKVQSLKEFGKHSFEPRIKLDSWASEPA